MPIKPPFEDSTLLALLREDSEYAFQLVFDRYRNRVYQLAMFYVKSPSLAEDIVQDVFLKIWFQRKKLPELSSFEAWLYTLTRNFTLNCVKKLAHEWKARAGWTREIRQFEEDTDHKLLNAQYKMLFSQAIGQLPEQQQKVFRLAREKNMSYEAIAAELSLSPLTVKTHMSRALAAIRTFLQKHCKEFLLFFIVGRLFF
ncbi:MAG TPA: RNA polymerase sigma-70 factor [Chitinophagaceae bacterium]|nr:RNA polymerase sigma-70 factor [Chitinophagaceae bacterium]